MLDFDDKFSGRILGIDEVGRGALAGPIFVAGVIIGATSKSFKGINDSKQISAAKRRKLSEVILNSANCYFASSNVDEIEEINVLQATLLAMRRLIRQVQETYDHIFIDGNQNPDQQNRMITMIPKGDGKSLAIAAASIIAKVKRDSIMQQLNNEYKEYHWGKNMGYGTQEHIAAIKEYGATCHHRTSFLTKII